MAGRSAAGDKRSFCEVRRVRQNMLGYHTSARILGGKLNRRQFVHPLRTRFLNTHKILQLATAL